MAVLEISFPGHIRRNATGYDGFSDVDFEYMPPAMAGRIQHHAMAKLYSSSFHFLGKLGVMERECYAVMHV